MLKNGVNMVKINKLFLYNGLCALAAIAALIWAKSDHKTAVLEPNIVKTFNLAQNALLEASSLTYYQEWLNKEEQHVWQELEKVISLSFEQCESLKTNSIDAYNTYITSMIKEYAALDKNVSEQTIQLVHAIMKDFGIDPKGITIYAWNLPSAAAACDTLIFINEPLLIELSPAAQKFAIGHELIHLIKKDHSANYFVEKAAINTDPASLHQLSQLQELRADILASLQGAEYAQGATEFFAHFIQKYGDQESSSHPKPSARLGIGKKIVGFLEKNKKTI